MPPRRGAGKRKVPRRFAVTPAAHPAVEALTERHISRLRQTSLFEMLKQSWLAHAKPSSGGHHKADDASPLRTRRLI